MCNKQVEFSENFYSPNYVSKLIQMVAVNILFVAMLNSLACATFPELDDKTCFPKHLSLPQAAVHMLWMS